MRSGCRKTSDACGVDRRNSCEFRSIGARVADVARLPRARCELDDGKRIAGGFKGAASDADTIGSL